MDNDLEVFMKRKIIASFLAAAVFSLVACVSSSDEEDETEKRCIEDPKLPICQEMPPQEEEEDDSSDGDF